MERSTKSQHQAPQRVERIALAYCAGHGRPSNLTRTAAPLRVLDSSVKQNPKGIRTRTNRAAFLIQLAQTLPIESSQRAKPKETCPKSTETESRSRSGKAPTTTLRYSPRRFPRFAFQ